ncbi:hypothetical protein FRC07_009922, partial [Ceratobasidium sp. 392]
MSFARELSIVSLPTRERDAAKAKLKAMRQGTAGTTATTTARKTRNKAPPPAATLASTRSIRDNRTKITFSKSQGGLKMNGVNRHDDVEPSIPAVPYLPGQEDIPHYDEEDDDADGTEPEDISPEMEGLLDHGNIYGGDIDSVDAGSAYAIEDTNMEQTNGASEDMSSQTPMDIDANIDLLQGTSQEDIRALIGTIGTDLGTFDTRSPIDTDNSTPTLADYNFGFSALNAAVNELQVPLGPTTIATTSYNWSGVHQGHYSGSIMQPNPNSPVVDSALGLGPQHATPAQSPIPLALRDTQSTQQSRAASLAPLT